jgi:ubiquinone/menaquinone biosynthesis C-methylase UbiE
MIDIAEYDTLDYDYSTYWEKRGYENLAEKNLLNKIFRSKRGDWFLDIGGSYGRLTSTYYDQYNHSVILDYSLKTLARNRDIIKGKYPNVELIAANAYKMPFKENSFDGALMVRVLHHIEEPDIYLRELYRIMDNNSLYIQEFANKIHIKAVVKSLIKLDFEIFKKDPYLQPKKTGSEGSNEEYSHIFYNYHPKHIEDLLKEQGLKLKRKHGCSFLRSPFIKKILGDDTMIFFEKIMQNTLSWTNIPPSIFMETDISKKEVKNVHSSNLQDLLVCPVCKKSLQFEKTNKAFCNSCSKEYCQTDDIWDFRVK